MLRYTPADRFAHGLDPRAKLAFQVGFVAATVTVEATDVGTARLSIAVTALGDEAPVTGDFVDVIGDGHDQDALAEEAGTIGYEILTSLGARYHRVYTGGGG